MTSYEVHTDGCRDIGDLCNEYDVPVFTLSRELSIKSPLFFISVSVWSSGVSPVSAPASNSKLVNLPRLFFKIAENLPFLTQGGLIMQSCRNSADMQAMF